MMVIQSIYLKRLVVFVKKLLKYEGKERNREINKKVS